MTTAAAKPPASTITRLVPLTLIDPNPKNARREYAAEQMDELTTSVREQGILQAILVRSWSGKDRFVVIAGSRRLRAAQAAGLKEVPAVIHVDITDTEADELEIVENAQRVDLAPLEEAEAFGKLHARGVTYEEIAARVGKKAQHVYQRCALLGLPDPAKKVLRAGRMELRTAVYLLRVPKPVRAAAWDAVVQNVGAGDDAFEVNHGALVNVVDRQFFLNLVEAPFDTSDASLIPKAGACGVCPKRTGNQAALFGATASDDVCTDAKCFQEKRLLARDRKSDDARKAGWKIFDRPEDTKKLWPNEWDSSIALSEPWVGLDVVVPPALDAKNRTWRVLVGGDKELTGLDKKLRALAFDRHDTPVELVDKDEARRLVKKARLAVAPVQKSSARGSSSSSSKTPTPAERQRQENIATMDRVVRAVHAEIRKKATSLSRSLVEALIALVVPRAAVPADLLPAWGITPAKAATLSKRPGGIVYLSDVKDLAALFGRMKDYQLGPAIVDVLLGSELEPGNPGTIRGDDSKIAPLAKAFKINVDAIEKATLAQIATEKAKTSKATDTPAKTAPAGASKTPAKNGAKKK